MRLDVCLRRNLRRLHMHPNTDVHYKSLCPNEGTKVIAAPVSTQLKPSAGRLLQGSSRSYICRLDRNKLKESLTCVT